jgi:hypothetical protein
LIECQIVHIKFGYEFLLKIFGMFRQFVKLQDVIECASIAFKGKGVSQVLVDLIGTVDERLL